MPTRPACSMNRLHRLASLALLLLTLLSGCGTKGALYLPDPRTGRLVTFGLSRGSADLIGWRTVTITQAMVGTRIAVFTSIEVKTPTGRIRSEQQAWLDAVTQAGGLAGIARSVTDAQALLSNLPT